VIVLEARDRVGGRIWTHHLSDGSTIDRGGAFLAPGHDAIHGLAKEVGVSTYKTWTKGDHLLIGGGRTRRYRGLIPKIGPLAVATIAWAQVKLDWMARQVPVDAPWTAKRAAEWDARTIASWLERCGIRKGVARELFEMSVRGLFTTDLNDVALLDLLFLIRSAGGFSTLMSIEGGYQENLVVGGAGSIARRVADDLGDRVRLNAPVRSITQRGDALLIEPSDAGQSSMSSERGSDPGPRHRRSSSRRLGGRRNGRAAVRWRISRRGYSRATGGCSGKRSGAFTGPGPRRQPSRTGRSTVPCGRASGRPPRSSMASAGA